MSKPAISPGLAARLKAARQSCSYVSSYQAAIALNVDTAVYSAMETVDDASAPKLVDYLAGVFGTTTRYLRKGSPSTSADRHAVQFEGSSDPARSKWTVEKAARVAERLRTVRLARGFRTAAQASAHYRWESDSYTEFEAGRRRFTTEKLETYAYAYDVPIEFFLDNGIGFAWSDDLLERRTAIDAKRFANAVRMRHPPKFVWIPRFDTLDGLLTSFVKDEATWVPDGHEPWARDCLRLHSKTTDLVIARVPWHSRGTADILIDAQYPQHPSLAAAERELVIHRDKLRTLRWDVFDGGAEANDLEVELRVPIVAVFAPALTITCKDFVKS